MPQYAAQVSQRRPTRPVQRRDESVRAPSNEGAVMSLQRTVGNQAVGRLLAQRTSWVQRELGDDGFTQLQSLLDEFKHHHAAARAESDPVRKGKHVSEAEAIAISFEKLAAAATEGERPSVEKLRQPLIMMLRGLRAAPDESSTKGNYRTDFSSPSVGTEQELSGVKIARPHGSENNIGTVSTRASKPEVLLEITTDMGGGVTHSGMPDYTLEIKTTPTEVTDAAGWKSRRDAFDALVTRINAADGKDLTLATGPLAHWELKINVKGHIIHGRVESSGKQATLGLPATEIGSLSPESRLIMAGAFWFNESYGTELSTNGLTQPQAARALYAFVVSAMTQLAKLTEKYHLVLDGLARNQGFVNNPLDPDVKNKWDVLPRTPPWKSLEALPSMDAAAVSALAKARGMPDGVTSSEVWAAAKKHITTSQDLAGHPVAAPTIGGKQGALFEFRSSVPKELEHSMYLTEPERDVKKDTQGRAVKIAEAKQSDSYNLLAASMKKRRQLQEDD